jgi:hypothetical protein
MNPQTPLKTFLTMPFYLFSPETKKPQRGGHGLCATLFDDSKHNALKRRFCPTGTFRINPHAFALAPNAALSLSTPLANIVAPMFLESLSRERLLATVFDRHAAKLNYVLRG